MSVIVPFHNEHLSTLLRTAASLVNRAPRHLLREVLLVDDASTKGERHPPAPREGSLRGDRWGSGNWEGAVKLSGAAAVHR